MRRVLSFFIRRSAAAVFTVLAMITLTFVLFWTIPSTPATFVYPYSQHLTSYQIHRSNQILGLDRPKVVQVASYVWHIARGDFGTAWRGVTVNGDQQVVGTAVGPPLFAATAVTASIVAGGAVLVLLLALPLGAVAGRLEGSPVDRAISLLTLIGICTHPMIIGLILRTVFGDNLHLLPAGGYCHLWPHAGVSSGTDYSVTCNGPVPWAEHLILPWVSFAFLFVALYTRMSRASVLETLHEDFVRTARAKGAGETRVLARHVLPNAGLRVLTMIGMEIGTALGICIYIESAFGMPGLGRLAVTVMFSTVDLPQILAVVTMITVVVVVGNVVVDTLYAIVDPRAGESLRARRSTRATGVLL